MGFRQASRSDGAAAYRRAAARCRSGRSAEALVAERLASLGWRLVARNVRVGRGELDLLAIDPGPPETLVAVEVRANRGSLFGMPEASVDRRKLRAVYRAAFALHASGTLPDGSPLPRLPLRVDLVAVEAGPALGPEAQGTVIRHLRGVTD